METGLHVKTQLQLLRGRYRRPANNLCIKIYYLPFMCGYSILIPYILRQDFISLCLQVLEETGIIICTKDLTLAHVTNTIFHDISKQYVTVGTQANG